MRRKGIGRYRAKGVAHSVDWVRGSHEGLEPEDMISSRGSARIRDHKRRVDGDSGDVEGHEECRRIVSVR